MCIILSSSSCVNLWKRKRTITTIKYVMNCNRLCVGDYNYITFQYDYTGIALYSDYDWIMNTVQVKFYDCDYFTIILLIKCMIMITVTVTVNL